MQATTYHRRRGELLQYFDRTAAESWKHLTSDAPVNRIRATVRAGRDRMRGLLLSWLPDDLHGRRILDAGCGTGALAREAALRGADVVAIDLSPTLVDHARERIDAEGGSGSVTFMTGDMLDPALGRFDHVVAMDSLIHYRRQDTVSALAGLAARTDHSLLFTFAPSTPALATMHAVGRLFPRGDRAPAIEPVRPASIGRLIRRHPALEICKIGRTERIASGFYTSEAMELVVQ